MIDCMGDSRPDRENSQVSARKETSDGMTRIEGLGKKERREMEGMEMQGEQMRLEFESRSENEQFARMVVAAFMLKCNPTVEELEDVKTAVSEAVTNCIIHGYENEVHTIRLAAALDGTWLTVTVEDDGVGIPDIEKAMEPMYTTKPQLDRSGMGFSFMEAFMDELHVVSREGRGTSVRMRKKIGSDRAESGNASDGSCNRTD